MSQRPVLASVMHERLQQDEKWGVQNHSDLAWLAVLAEEFGEAAQVVVESSVPPDARPSPNLERELVQVAAVAIAWIECIRRRKEADRE